MSEEMTRKEVIWQLKGLLLGELRTTTKERKALEYAIASLKTDEAYQLEYENRDCVEVVRCKDCKHYKGNSCEWHNGFKPPVDWFCADGERE